MSWASLHNPAFRVALLLAVLALGTLWLSGCASHNGSAGRGSRALPWNWFARDNVAALEKAEGRLEQAQTALVKEAQANVRASGHAIAVAPASREVAVAAQFNTRADAQLAQAVGAVAAGEDARLRVLVDRLRSELEAEREQGVRELAQRDRVAASLSDALTKSEQAVAAATDKLKASDLKYQAQAAKYRRLVFWVVAGVVAWFALQLLAGAAKFFPALSPVSRVAGLVSAPVSQALANRSLGAVGRALAGVERLSANAASFARQQLDAEFDEAEQRQARAAYERVQEQRAMARYEAGFSQ